MLKTAQHRDWQEEAYQQCLDEVFQLDGWLEMEMRRGLSYGDLHNHIDTREGDLRDAGPRVNQLTDSVPE